MRILRGTGLEPGRKHLPRIRNDQPFDTKLDLRAINNGEMPEEYDPETGRAYPRSRVWRWECEFVPVWIIELPA